MAVTGARRAQLLTGGGQPDGAGHAPVNVPTGLDGQLQLSLGWGWQPQGAGNFGDSKTYAIADGDRGGQRQRRHGRYDGTAQAASGTASGVGGANLNTSLNRAVRPPDVPGGHGALDVQQRELQQPERGCREFVISR